MGTKRTAKEQYHISEARRQARVKIGLCYQCGKKNDRHPTGNRCTPCNYKGNEYRNKVRRSLRATGFCACKKPSVAGNRCWNCWLDEFSIKLCGTVALRPELENLWKSQNGCCAYTGEKLVPGKTASLDHIHPRAKGGTHNIENLQWLSKKVNYSKRDLTQDEFFDLCETIIKRGRPKKPTA